MAHRRRNQEFQISTKATQGNQGGFLRFAGPRSKVLHPPVERTLSGMVGSIPTAGSGRKEETSARASCGSVAQRWVPGLYPGLCEFESRRSHRVVSINSDASVSYTDESGAIPERPIRTRLMAGRQFLALPVEVRFLGPELAL